MSFQSAKNALNRRLGEQVFLSALKGFASDTNTPFAEKISIFCALVILSTPWILIASGLVVLWFGRPSPLIVVFALLLFGFAWLIRPRRAALPKQGLKQDDLPHVFATLNSISSAMAAPKIDLVFVDFSYDFVSVTRFRFRSCDIIRTPLISRF